jgi:hypothetical protein
MTREQERLDRQKKAKLNRGCDLIQEITHAIKFCENIHREGLIKKLEEVGEILKKHVGENAK